MTRILHVFSTFAVGGPQIRFAQLANALSGQYRHTIVSLDGASQAMSRLAPDVQAEFLPMAELKAMSLPQRLHAIHRTLSHHQPDILMTYNWGAIEWAFCNRLLRLCRGIHWEDGFSPDEASRLYRRRNLFRRHALSGQTQVVVPSRTLMAIARQHWQIPDQRLHYFPNGIAMPEAIRKRPPSAVTTLITLASLRAEKNLHRLIDTFACHATHSRLLIGGDGPMLTELEAYIDSLSLTNSVRLAGRIEDVWGFLAQGDIFCLSSDTEQMPLSVLEAMAAALPVVATDVGDVKTIVAAENTPFVVPPAHYASAFRRILSEPRHWQAIGAANCHKARQHYSFQHMLENFTRLTAPLR
ncbi:glycosyltransferase family 4 protein [Photobacterium halotolerans]|uniref:glycosyltransferase family 4 protein n=1 Tax=Photobacterium halotolerans TaxID=265726 RepID=UPI000402B22F|nr:glycosyltransferase family 4 protein [Photobacterium halotolerans]